MRGSRILHSFSKKIETLDNDEYILVLTLFLYFFLWAVNPANKVIILLFLLLPVAIIYKLKNLRMSLVLAYIISLIIPAGKSYLIELIPPGFFDKYLFPEGYNLSIVIEPSHVLAILMFFILARDFVLGKLSHFRLNIMDYFVLIFFLWMIVSDFFGSNRFEISILLTSFLMTVPVVYFYLRAYSFGSRLFIKLLLIVFISQVFFESTVAFRQLAAGSPINKNIESLLTIDVEHFGLTSDDISLNFRPAGTFDHANELGMWLSFNLCLLLPFVYKMKKPLYITSFVLGFIGLVITLSRSAWVGVFIGMLIILFILEKLKKVTKPKFPVNRYSISITLILLISFVFFFLPRLISSVNTFSEGTGSLRVEQVEETINLIFANPVFGVGTGLSVLEAISFNPQGVFSHVALSVNNWFLLLTVEHGFFALAIFIGTLIVFVKKYMIPNLTSSSHDMNALFGVGIAGGILSILTIGIFQLYMGVTMLFLSYAILVNNNVGSSKAFIKN